MTGAADIAHLLSGTMLVLTLLMLGQRRLMPAITLYSLQSAMLALAAGAQGWVQARSGFWILAFVLLAVQAVLIPAALRSVTRETSTPARAGPAAMAIGVCVVVLAILAIRETTLPAGMAREDLAAAVSVMALGLLTVIIQRDRFWQMLGFLSASSGCTLAGLAMPGLPMPMLLLGVAPLLIPALGCALVHHQPADAAR